VIGVVRKRKRGLPDRFSTGDYPNKGKARGKGFSRKGFGNYESIQGENSEKLVVLVKGRILKSKKKKKHTVKGGANKYDIFKQKRRS